MDEARHVQLIKCALWSLLANKISVYILYCSPKHTMCILEAKQICWMHFLQFILI